MNTNELVIHEKPEAAEEAKAAFDRLVREEAGSLLRLARLLLRDTEEAQDLLQDSLLKAYLSLESFRWECSLRTWTSRILVNQGIKRLRRRRLKERLSSLLGGGQSPAGLPPEWTANRERTPEEATALNEQATALAHALPGLSARQQVVLVLRYMEGLPVASIAEVLQVGEGTVKTHLVRAVRSIRAQLVPLHPGARGKGESR